MLAPRSPSLRRRGLLLASTAWAAVISGLPSPAAAKTIQGAMPWAPNAGAPPIPVQPGPWRFFTTEEVASVEAIVDRLIPPDDLGPGGKDAGCAVFMDRQLAGPYGQAAGLYRAPPFLHGTPEQGKQEAGTPAEHLRAGLRALDQHCRAVSVGKPFAALPPEQQDRVLTALEKGEAQLEGVQAQQLFEQVLQLTIEGFFADPVYGGNRDLAGWRLIGFPGVRYDYRDWVERHGEPYPHPPVGIGGRAAWRPKT